MAEKTPKRAVILIHGIGEQVPMATLRGFVDAVWTSNAKVIPADQPDGETGQAPRIRNPVWSKPDERNHSYELHRITTEKDSEGVRTDFYEYYWAHLMHGSTWAQVAAWLRKLLLRSPTNVPYAVYWAWLAAWFVALAVAALIAAAVIYRKLPAVADAAPWIAAAAAFVAVALPIYDWLRPSLSRFLVGYIGDIVRYVEPLPPNVARRQEIRERGVALLERLMGVNAESIAANVARIKRGEPDDPPVWQSGYDQIIVVGHSLGTVVGYDILKHAFARINTLVGIEDAKPALAALEDYSRSGRSDPAAFDTAHFQTLQAAAAKELAAQGSPWIVSDFVTLGSPLTHADFLMASGHDDLYLQQTTRVLPTCPPALEWDKVTGLDHLSYASPHRSRREKVMSRADNGDRVPHHAAHFGFTRWTNIHSPHRWVVVGDLVSGPVGRLFGLRNKVRRGAVLEGALDVSLGHEPGRFPRFLTHTLYWYLANPGRRIELTADVPKHIKALRDALGL